MIEKRLTHKRYYAELENGKWSIWHTSKSNVTEFVLEMTANKTVHPMPEWSTAKAKTYQKQQLALILTKINVTVNTVKKGGIVTVIRSVVDNLDSFYKSAAHDLETKAQELGVSSVAIMDAKYPPHRYNVDSSDLGIAKRLAALIDG